MKKISSLFFFHFNYSFLIFSFFLLSLPLFLENAFYYDVIILWMFNAVICLGLNLLIGYAGQISLGHAAFFGISAYLSAILTDRYHFPPLLSIVITLAGVCLLAFIIAKPIFKLTGHYLAMGTLAVGIIIYFVIRNEAELTGGADGMAVNPLKIFNYEIIETIHWYFILAFLLIFILWLIQNLLQSNLGRLLRGLHDSEIAIAVVGINVANLKSLIFVFSVGIASLMGSLYSFYAGFISPQESSFLHSIELLAMVVVGGMGSLYGGILGALFFTVIPQFLVFFEEYEMMLLGFLIVFIMFFFPQGLSGLIEKAKNIGMYNLKKFFNKNNL